MSFVVVKCHVQVGGVVVQRLSHQMCDHEVTAGQSTINHVITLGNCSHKWLYYQAAKFCTGRRVDR